MSLRDKADHLMYRLLWLQPPVKVPPFSLDNAVTAERAFGFSLIFSAVCCILQYVILPFVLPLVGLSIQVATPVILVINIVALLFIVYSLRRFWQINYKYKWQYLPVAIAAFIAWAAFIVLDVVTLIGG